MPANLSLSKSTASPDLENSAGDEVLHQGDRTFVTRRQAPGGAPSIIIKRAIGADAMRRLRHERSVLARLATVEGVARLAPGNWPDDTLALHDDAGVPLASVLTAQPAPLQDVLQLGVQLSRTLASVHRQGVVHKDINPSNILLSGLARRPVLIDFNIAAVSGESCGTDAPETHFAGTLAYMPPEQTGRTGRSVDQRSDLYALGAVLYRLITGKPVIEANDLLDVLQQQLTTVPTAPLALVPGLPRRLSELVMRLLEKEPDLRYQSAEGVAHDLERLAHTQADDTTPAFALGERDFAARLVPPERPLGREPELAALESALAQAARGQAVCMLVSGEEGVGKTVLANQLRAAVAARHGWFVSGQFDESNSGRTSATVHALHELGKLLLSQPEAELTKSREQLIEALGPDISAGITQIAEFKLLLGEHRQDGQADPLTAQQRAVRGAISVLRSVVSHERPLVMLLDDAQRAPDVSMRFVDSMLAARAELPGLLLVLTYRPKDITDTSPLTAGLARWASLEAPPAQLALERLDREQIGELVGAMLRLAPPEAMRLGSALSERTRGNPQDTIELINTLRADGLLVPTATGWDWDAPSIRRFVGENDGDELLARRLGKLPPSCLQLMRTLACLGHTVPLALLETAADPALGDALSVLAPATEDGLLVIDADDETTLRFRNQRIQAGVQARQGEAQTRQLRLAMARRLSQVAKHHRQAAQQYIDALPEVSEPAERRRAAALLHEAALLTQAPNAEASEHFAKAAIEALRPIEGPQDSALMLALMVLRHLLLYGLGRHAEADKVYAAITARCTDPFLLAEPASVQVHSLNNRGQPGEGVALGLGVLEQLGLSKPADMAAAISAGMSALSAWIDNPDKVDDLTRPEANAPELMVLIKFMKGMFTAAFNHDKSIYTWLLLECHRLWTVHGPCAPLMSSIASLSVLMASGLQNYRAAHATAQHAIMIGEARGYEPATSIACSVSALFASHWIDPLEDTLALTRRARKGLEPVGDLQNISNAFGVGVFMLIETATNLETVSQEIDESLAFEERTGHHASGHVTRLYRQFILAMRGETHGAGSFNDDNFNEEAFLLKPGFAPSARGMLHILRSMSALMFGDYATLSHHAQAALSSVATTPGFYANSLPQLCSGMALAEQIRSAKDTDTADLLAELDRSRDWLSARAADAPANFLHMVCLLDAERAWALGQPWLAGETYERALVEASRHSRPWHRAVIGERAARFYFAHGWHHTGQPLLVEAARGFAEWGAAGKVQALQTEFGFLRQAMTGRQPGTTGRSTSMSSDDVDMLAILRASQALSSETSLANLNACVARVLGAMCGATSVLMVVRPREAAGWFLATSLEQGRMAMSVEQAGQQGLLALSAFRYAERTREPLLLEDATRDSRFSADPALKRLEYCSLLLVPILKQGEMQAVLVLENSMRRSAFSADRLDAVTLIAGQLAVSLDNALLYGSLESKVAERTAALEDANRKLEQLSVTDALTGLANRRQFNQALDVEWQRARRAGTPVGLAMIDIDQFKQYNDHYGHQGGDTCLQLVAEAMKTGLRTGTDLIARYGGEEFVLLLRDSDLDGTRVAAERLRAAVAAKLEPHLTSMHGIVTISIGIASCVPTADMTPAQCLEIADAALYSAKHAGRNQVGG